MKSGVTSLYIQVNTDYFSGDGFILFTLLIFPHIILSSLCEWLNYAGLIRPVLLLSRKNVASNPASRIRPVTGSVLHHCTDSSNGVFINGSDKRPGNTRWMDHLVDGTGKDPSVLSLDILTEFDISSPISTKRWCWHFPNIVRQPFCQVWIHSNSCRKVGHLHIWPNTWISINHRNNNNSIDTRLSSHWATIHI